MNCPRCERPTHFVRRRCPACKRQQPSFYILTIILLIVICFGGLALLGKLPWHT
jgi:hypothetical protein